jgi:lipoprotein-anchoring transpeptidase ErfK/SrfK
MIVLAASRLPGLRPGVAAVTAVLATVAIGVATVPADAAAHAAGTREPALRPLVVLLHDHVVQVRPHPRSPRVELVAGLRPLTGVRTVLPLLGRTTGRGGKHWLRVRLPGRPNGHTGWIDARRTRAAATSWRLVLDLSDRRIAVSRDGRVSRRFRAVVGKPSTPTPTGHFFVEEALALGAQVGGPFALATSARSNVLQEFEGGPGQIAIHGTNDLAGALGSAASHGCIRLGSAAIAWLAQRIGGGVPLLIVP